MSFFVFCRFIAKSFTRCLLPLLIGVFAGCGGGGGGGSRGSEEVSRQYNYVPRNYADSWQLEVTSRTIDGKESTRLIDHYIDAVNPSNLAVTLYDESNDDGSSELWTLDGQTIVSNFCSYSPGQHMLDFPLFVGKSWNKTFIAQCIDVTNVQIEGRVSKEEKISVPAGSFDTLRVELSISYTPADTNDAYRSQSTCWWAAKLGIFVRCTTSITYDSPRASAVSTTTTQLTNLAFARGLSSPFAPNSLYPAFMPSAPTLGTASTGATAVVLQAPKILPVFFSDYQQSSRYLDFLSKLIGLSEWDLLSEYGVGKASLLSPITVGNSAPGVINDHEIEAWLLAQAQTWPQVVPETLAVIVYPASTIVNRTATGESLCSDFPSYSDWVTLPGGAKLAYVVVADCAGSFATVAHATSKALFDSATNPFNTGFTDAQFDAGWMQAFEGAYITDMCTQRYDFAVYPDGLRYPIARFWSNARAQAGLDPCVPISEVSQRVPYFNSVPNLPDMVEVNGKLAKGVVVPAGNTKVIDIDLFSNLPTNGEWYVAVLQGGTDSLSESKLGLFLDKSRGQNGDKLRLMIGAPVLPNGATFVVYSLYGGMMTSWVGSVANEAAAPITINSNIVTSQSYGFPGDQITLDATSSTSSDNAVLQYEWTQLSGAPVNLVNPVSATSSFTVLPGQSSGNLKFQLTVKHPNGQQKSSMVDVYAYNSLSDGYILKLRGDLGDAYLNGGNFDEGRPLNFRFSTAAADNSTNQLTIAIYPNFITPSWVITVKAPGTTDLQIGAYNGAIGTPSNNPGAPGLTVTHNGFVCSSSVGQFTISQLNSFIWTGMVFSLGGVALDFDLHCPSSASGANLQGAFRLKSTVPLSW